MSFAKRRPSSYYKTASSFKMATSYYIVEVTSGVRGIILTSSLLYCRGQIRERGVTFALALFLSLYCAFIRIFRGNNSGLLFLTDCKPLFWHWGPVRLYVVNFSSECFHQGSGGKLLLKPFICIHLPPYARLCPAINPIQWSLYGPFFKLMLSCSFLQEAYIIGTLTNNAPFEYVYVQHFSLMWAHDYFYNSF